MQYTIRHVTTFTYEAPISESVMEARMQPRTDGSQRCIRFALSTTPVARVRMYHDHDGNVVHHFNIAGRHSRLIVTAEALVDCTASGEYAAPEPEWTDVDASVASGEFWDLINPSPYTRPTPLLAALSREIEITRHCRPLEALHRLTQEIHRRFEYNRSSTRVDSPIDDALSQRRGVCQDFAHVFIALVRALGIPCRYVSGYLYRPPDSELRSTDGATHAWAEAWLPGAGWIGFDPTNNVLAGERHVRVAVGRDYADVPPTRGVFKGVSNVRSELAVGVAVGVAAGFTGDTPTFVPWMSQDASLPLVDAEASQQQ